MQLMDGSKAAIALREKAALGTADTAGAVPA
jgi:hypothetical protein